MELDENRLAAFDSTRKKRLYIFQYLSLLEKDLKRQITQTGSLANQRKVEQDLLTCLQKPEFGCNSIRKLISKCFICVYKLGDTRSLFDVFIKLQSLLNQTKDNKIKA